MCMILAMFRSMYLRKLIWVNIERQLNNNFMKGFPRMFLSLDSMHYMWKHYIMNWQGQFQNKDGYKSIILEVIIDQSLWIMCIFFGLPNGNNDVNLLDQSPLICYLLNRLSHDFNFVVNRTTYLCYYFLTNNIYSPWSCFVQTL
jgi:hypothetical protein